MKRSISTLTTLAAVALTFPSIAAAQEATDYRSAFTAHGFQGTVAESGATISGVRFILAGASGLGIEAMMEAQGGFIENMAGEAASADYAAFNLQLGLVKRFVGDGTSALIPYVAGGWYPAFERTGDEIASFTGLYYANGGAEFKLMKGFGLFAEAGLGFAAESTPMIFRFGFTS